MSDFLGSLPFDHVVVYDTEFTARDGEPVIPICLVATDLITDTTVRIWFDELGSVPPFPTDSSTLWVAYNAAAEHSFFLAAGWPLPERVLDLMIEFKNIRNKAVPKIQRPKGEGGLVAALAHYGIQHTMSARKDEIRNRCIEGGPFTDAERIEILEYCESDVTPLALLLEHLVVRLRAQRRLSSSPRRGLGQAIYRGHFQSIAARMEQRGIPVDMVGYRRLQERADDIKRAMIEKVDAQYGVFRGETIAQDLFYKYLEREGLVYDWPRTATGRLATDKDTLSAAAKTHMQLQDLHQVSVMANLLNEPKFAIGADGRNRTPLWAFNTATGRNAPSPAKSLFGASVWLRSLIKPEPGMALAYLDFCAQEIHIAGALSGDPELLATANHKDPYLDGFAIPAGLAPPGATKDSHGEIRDVCKTALLGLNYGRSAHSLAAGTGLHILQVEALMRYLDKLYAPFKQFQANYVATAKARLEITTGFGWRASVVTGAKTTTLMNFPCQAFGSEMLRLACQLIEESGVRLLWPVHDAVLIEAPADEIEGAIAIARECMAEASRIVLYGTEVHTSIDKLVVYPQRYIDKRAAKTWPVIRDLLGLPPDPD